MQIERDKQDENQLYQWLGEDAKKITYDSNNFKLID